MAPQRPKAAGIRARVEHFDLPLVELHLLRDQRERHEKARFAKSRRHAAHEPLPGHRQPLPFGVGGDGQAVDRAVEPRSDRHPERRGAIELKLPLGPVESPDPHDLVPPCNVESLAVRGEGQPRHQAAWTTGFEAEDRLLRADRQSRLWRRSDPLGRRDIQPELQQNHHQRPSGARPEEMRRHGQGKSGDSGRVSRLFIVAGPRLIPPGDSFKKARDRGHRRHTQARRVRFPEQLPSASRPRLVRGGSPPSGPTPLVGFPPPGLRVRPVRPTV